MADVQSHRSQPRGSGGPAAATSSILRRFQENAPTSAQLVGLLTLVVSGGILLLLTGLTLTASIVSLIFFTPLIIISSPVWIPVGSLLFLAAAGFLSVCGLGIAAAITVSWLYRYLNGFHPPGSDRIDYARSRIVDTANHVKDYAGGYLHGKAKDAAPSA